MNVGTSTFISALLSDKVPLSQHFLCLSNNNFQLSRRRRWPSKARRVSKEDSASSIMGNQVNVPIHFFVDIGLQLSPLRLPQAFSSYSYHHTSTSTSISTSTCITIALFANMRRPLLFSPTALYPDHGLSAVTCRSLHLPSL